MAWATIRRWRERDGLALAIIAVGSVVATVAWRGMSRPMVDTVGYRATVLSLEQGWEQAQDRIVGYPLLLMATGSGHHSTRLLFFVQLAMHIASVLLVVDLARRFGVGRHGRAALAALLFAPVVMLRVVHEGTECLSALLLTAVCWMLLVRREGSIRWSLATGALCGAAALVRPTFALLFVPVAAVAAIRAPAHRWRAALGVALPALLLVAAFVTVSGLRFGSWSLTPNLAFNLNSRTSTYVEKLPARFEPGRSVLIRERDLALLRGEEWAPQNYVYRARPALEEATGLRDRELERYLLEVDLYLITHHPFDYLAAVTTSTVNYAQFDSQPTILGLGRPAAWFQQALHLPLALAFLGTLSLIPGLALAGAVDRTRLVPLVVAGVLSLYNLAISVGIEAGTARLRSPTEPLLALAFVLGISIVRSVVRERRPYWSRMSRGA